jgi:hypothetical protein
LAPLNNLKSQKIPPFQVNNSCSIQATALKDISFNFQRTCLATLGALFLNLCNVLLIYGESGDWGGSKNVKKTEECQLKKIDEENKKLGL